MRGDSEEQERELELQGFDDQGNILPSLEEFWKLRKSNQDRTLWFEKSLDYWNKADASVDGVLGGYGSVSTADIKESKSLLRKLFPSKSCSDRVALDCGAGMGRISKGLLLPLFGKVDLVEASSVQLEKAKSDLQSHANIGRFINSGLESFPPDKEYYDCIWIQWVVGYLPDDDLVDFLIRCKLALKPLKSSVIILKENVTRDARYFLDTEDNNVIRSNSQFLSIFSRAGLVLTTSKYQREFPKELFPVCMYVLSPPAQ